MVNAATIGPIVFSVGLQVSEEVLNFMSSRHYSTFIIGIFPLIYNWVVNVSARSPLMQGEPGYNSNYPDGSAGFYRVLAWKRGALLVSMIWVAMVVMVLDRKWKSVSIWASIGALEPSLPSLVSAMSHRQDSMILTVLHWSNMMN